MDNEPSYNHLKNAVLQYDYPQDTLEMIKEFYAPEIDSLRRSGCINNMHELLDCLERRDVLSEYSIEPLRRIAPPSDHHLQQAMEVYEARKPSLPNQLNNAYEQMRLNDELQQRLSEMSVAPTRTLANHSVAHLPAPKAEQTVSSLHYPKQQLSGKTRSEIAKLLANDIGRSWRSFGRELEVTEGTMDDIELKHSRDLPSCVHRLLQLVEEDASRDPRQHVLLLCRALEGCGRKDLRRKIENIMSYA